MSLYSAIDCSEEHISVSEDMLRETGVAAKVVLRCAWIDRFLLMDDLISNNRVWPNGSLTVPPLVSGCTSVPSPTSYVTVGQSCEYTDALVTVNYSNKANEDNATDVFSESLEPNAEFITADHAQFRWTSATGEQLLEAEAPGFLLRSCNLVRTLYNLSSLPANLITLVGTSNQAAYTSTLLGCTFPIETLMFQPPAPSRKFTTTGTEGWTLQLKFAFKPQGWNRFWRAASAGGAGGWDQIFHIAGAQYKPHPPADFSAYLF